MASKQQVIDSIGNIALSPKEIVQFLKTGIKANQPMFLWGPPGVAKSALVKKVAKEMDYGLYDFRALLRDTVDLNGIPTVSQDGRYTNWLRPSWLPEEDNPQFEKNGILFLDELNAAPPSMQAACYQLVHDRKVGEHDLHPGWIPIAAGNNDTDGAVTSRMPTPLKSRFLHANIAMEDEKDGVRKLKNQDKWCNDWLEWGRDEGGLHPLVIAYHRFTGGSDLYAFSKTSQTFPCLRTWEFVSNILKAQPSAALLFPMLAGTIGPGYASKACAFIIDASELPDVEEILKHPDTVTIPRDGGRKYAMACALSAKLTGMETKEFNPAMTQAMVFIERMEKDFQVCILQDVHAGKPKELQAHKAVKQWSAGACGALVMEVLRLNKEG